MEEVKKADGPKVAEEELTYDEITLTGDEIKQLKAIEPVAVPEKTRIVYHNKVVNFIQKTIRRAAKNKEKEVFITTSNIFENASHPACWQKEVVKSIVSKMKENKVGIAYIDHCDCVEAKI